MKVFGVGFLRTGTSSLTKALNLLCIKTLQFPKQLYYDIDHDIIREFEGFTDSPITLLYKELDKRYPNSKFIHTIRDEKTWLASIEWFYTIGKVKYRESFTEYGSKFSMLIYGTTQFDQKLFLQKYREHNEDVLNYFANRPDDYLMLDITRGEGFEKLCAFLDKPMTGAHFPHLNKRERIFKVYGRRFYKAIRKTMSLGYRS